MRFIKFPFPIAIGIRAFCCYSFFVVRDKNPRFRPKNRSKIAKKRFDFGNFQKPFAR